MLRPNKNLSVDTSKEQNENDQAIQCIMASEGTPNELLSSIVSLKEATDDEDKERMDLVDNIGITTNEATFKLRHNSVNAIKEEDYA